MLDAHRRGPWSRNARVASRGTRGAMQRNKVIALDGLARVQADGQRLTAATSAGDRRSLLGSRSGAAVGVVLKELGW
jgi:hypothetical protein